MFTDSRW